MLNVCTLKHKQITESRPSFFSLTLFFSISVCANELAMSLFLGAERKSWSQRVRETTKTTTNANGLGIGQ